YEFHTSIVAVRKLNIASVRQENIASNGQSHAGPCHLMSNILTSVKLVEHSRTLRFTERLTFVANSYENVIFHAFRSNLNSGPSRRILQRIIHKLSEGKLN